MLVVILIALQPNFSTAGMIFVSSLMLLFVGKVKIKHMAFTVLSLIPIGALYVLSKPYILNRIFLYTEHTSGGDTSYQLSQALIGFGNGAWFGVGPGNSNQKEFFLPQSYDFVFRSLAKRRIRWCYAGSLNVCDFFPRFSWQNNR
jgi:cell division protein FtsW